jgi:hypothetical protein
MKESYLFGNVTISDAIVPVVFTTLNFKDFLGAVMVRWGFNRDKYRVTPGLYAVGKPDQESDVFVTAI